MSGRTFRATLGALVLLLVFCFFSVPSFAENDGQAAQDAAKNALPEGFNELFTSGNELRLPDLPLFLEALFKALSAQLKESGADLALFFGGILLCSIFSLLQSSLSKGRDGPLRLCLLIFGCVSVFGACKGIANAASSHLTAICRLLSGFAPAITAAAVTAGGVGSAAVSAAAISTILSFVGQFSIGVILPLEKITLAMDLGSAATGNGMLSAFAKTLRGAFTFFLGAASAVISAVFAFQNVVAAKGDSVALRAFRFTAGSAVPLVGGVFSETSRTLAAGMGLIRSTIGAVGALSVLLLFLPVFLLLVLTRFILKLSASLSGALDASPLDRLYESGASAAGMLCAVTAITDLCCFFALAVTAYTID